MPALAAAPQQVASEPMNRTIRPLVAADRSGVFRILENAGNFTPEEVATALELIDEWLELGEHSGYLTYVLEARDEDSSAVLGYVCFGPTPLTESTFDLYWICLLYTSDAADDLLCVDLGGRRIIKKKKKNK